MNNYQNCREAIAAFLIEVELEMLKNPDEELQVEVNSINGQYILDRLQAETDMIEIIAAKVRVAIRTAKLNTEMLKVK